MFKSLALVLLVAVVVAESRLVRPILPPAMIRSEGSDLTLVDDEKIVGGIIAKVRHFILKLILVQIQH